MEMGMDIGIAFQIRNDVIDIYGSNKNTVLGRDIVGGKRSIFVAYCFSNTAADESEWLLNILDKPPELTTQEDIQSVSNFFESYLLNFIWSGLFC